MPGGRCKACDGRPRWRRAAVISLHLLFDKRHRHLGQMDDLGCRRTEYKVAQSAHAARAHHDQVDTFGFRHACDVGRGLAEKNMGSIGPAGGVEQLARIREHRLPVLALRLRDGVARLMSPYL